MTTPDAPKILQIPIGINASGTRRETDFMGEIEVPADRYWGAQTQQAVSGWVRVMTSPTPPPAQTISTTHHRRTERAVLISARVG